jgi:hypothetical protein
VLSLAEAPGVVAIGKARNFGIVGVNLKYSGVTNDRRIRERNIHKKGIEACGRTVA